MWGMWAWGLRRVGCVGRGWTVGRGGVDITERPEVDHEGPNEARTTEPQRPLDPKTQRRRRKFRRRRKEWRVTGDPCGIDFVGWGRNGVEHVAVGGAEALCTRKFRAPWRRYAGLSNVAARPTRCRCAGRCCRRMAANQREAGGWDVRQRGRRGAPGLRWTRRRAEYRLCWRGDRGLLGGEGGLRAALYRPA